MNILIEICGWTGSILYAIYAFPQTLFVIKQGSARQFSMTFLTLMEIGAFCSLISTLMTQNWALMLNFACTLICSTIMFRYKIWERKK